MDLSAFQLHLQAARESNQARDAYYLQKGAISPALCSPVCAGRLALTELRESLMQEDMQQAFQVFAFMQDMVAAWEIQGLYSCDDGEHRAAVQQSASRSLGELKQAHDSIQELFARGKKQRDMPRDWEMSLGATLTCLRWVLGQRDHNFCEYLDRVERMLGK
jgi:hypothetical protein